MRELFLEEIMTTRVAIPNFVIGCRMSEMRRRLLPSPTPEQQSVRRNLFGPIDHEENYKFVQAELKKISQADSEKWNFDFSENKPKEGGRFKWEAVGASDVPSAYHLPTLTNINQSTTCVVPSFRNKVETTPPKATTAAVPSSLPSSSSSPSTSSAVDEIVDSVKATTTATTTTVAVIVPPRSSSTSSTVPSVPVTQVCNKVTVESKKSLDNGPRSHLLSKPSERLQQTSIKDMFKIKKRPLNGSTKVDTEDAPPSLLKRQRTTT